MDEQLQMLNTEKQCEKLISATSGVKLHFFKKTSDSTVFGSGSLLNNDNHVVSYKTYGQA